MMRKVGVLLFVVFFLGACSLFYRGPQLVILRGMVFGTYYSISYYEDDGRVFQEAIDSIFRDFNRTMSLYDPQSLISRINRNEEHRVDDYFEAVFMRAQEISEETGGAFDPTVFPLVNAWGFGFSERAEMTRQKVDSMLAFVGYRKISLEDGLIEKKDHRVQLDFNAIAKGYAADLVGLFLETKGVQTYLVEIGGDLATRGVKPDGSKWRIGLEIPAEDFDAPQQWEYYVEVKDIGLATSGDYRRFHEEDGKRYSHTIDPKTGYPVAHHLLSVSVFASDGMSADAYATAFMVMGLEESIAFVEERDDLEAYFIYALDDQDGYGYYASTGLDLIPRGDL